MYFVNPYFYYNHEPSKKDLKIIERIGRNCYKSENKITEDSYEKFVKNLIDRKHESVLEHSIISVHICTSRGVTHELVRHRIASFTQESTRYCNYNKLGIRFVIPDWCDQIKDMEYTADTNYDFIKDECQRLLISSCLDDEKMYNSVLQLGRTPEKAREVLPNCLATEIDITANLREWRHIMKLRTSQFAHPNCREIMTVILNDFKTKIPIMFDDIEL